MFLFLDMFGGFFSAVEGFFQAVANFLEAVGAFFASQFSPAGRAVSHLPSQTYHATMQFVSDAKSRVSQTVSHAFNFSSAIQSVNVTLTLNNVASMHFQQLVVDFHIAGQTAIVPVTNPLSGPSITVDSGPVYLGSFMSIIGISVDVTGVLCGSSCSNLTFTPSADLIASVPPQ
jgi:hypothetical protein